MNIAYLGDHKEVIPILARWFHQEWSYLYPDRTLSDFEQSIGERTNKDKIPMALVAFEGDELLGTVCLKVHDMDSCLDLTPWLAGLYVTADRPGRNLQALPLLRRNFPAKYGLGLPQHHSQLRNRVFTIRWDGETMFFIYHELMTSSDKRSLEA